MIIVPNRKPNRTHISQQFAHAKPPKGEYERDPFLVRFPNREPMPRLGFGKMTPKLDISIDGLRHSILTNTFQNAILFPDTGFITTAIPEHFWSIVSPRTLAFPQMTVAELSGWLSKPNGNQYLHPWLKRAFQQCTTTPPQQHSFSHASRVLGLTHQYLNRIEVAVIDRAALARAGYDYYVSLLSLRKRFGIVAYRELRTKCGYEPTEREFRQYLSDNFHPRLAERAFKGWKDQLKPNFLADEELVVTAALTAILSGRETVILTRDNDVFDNFAKLMDLFVVDYMAFHFGLACHLNPSGYPMFSFPVPQTHDQFEGDEVYGNLLPLHKARSLLPDEIHPVVAYCYLVGNTSLDPKISLASFCLEMEMGPLLRTKWETNGKNSAFFPGRDAIASISPNPNVLNIMFAICVPQRTTYEGMDVTRMDLARALHSDMVLLMDDSPASDLIYPVKKPR